MQNITGKIAFGGIAIGKIKEISKENNVVRRVKIEDAKAEIARFEAARDQAAEELKGLYDKAVKEVGEASAAIFEVHQMMLEDEDYLEAIQNMIQTEQVNAAQMCLVCLFFELAYHVKIHSGKVKKH